MPTKLRKLKITRVAVCEQGACYDPQTDAGAHILLFKAMDDDAPRCTDEDCEDEDCPVHGTQKQATDSDLPASVILAMDACDDEDCDDPACPVHGTKKEELTVGDVYAPTAAGTAGCTDSTCTDPDCPVHGSTRHARRKRRVSKGPLAAMGAHPEPDGDETPPLDYATRGQQYDLWECLWGKWECFCTTFHDIIGDADEDNIPYLPILVQSIEQFGADVQQLLTDCGVAKAFAPALSDLSTIAKAGAAMAGHRRKRLQDAISALQAILEECTPEDLPHGVGPDVNRAGVSAAEVTGYGPGPYVLPVSAAKGASMPPATAPEDLAAALARAETAEARIKDLEAQVAKSQQDLETLKTEMAITKMSPEEQREHLLASMPELVRKSYLDQETRLAAIEKMNRELAANNERLDYIAKAAPFRPFGMVPEKHWRLLKAIDTMPEEEDRTELLRLMQASCEQQKTAGLFTAYGSDGHGANGQVEGGSATDQLMAMTEAYAKENKVTFMEASEAIAKQHRDLYERSIRERRRHVRVSSD